ncbi:MAG: hypothetical protein L3J94_07200 [Gammaproteobacteria bacterium]|nr:hypothetical protein [Gammaproteobacteria bacterium]
MLQKVPLLLITLLLSACSTSTVHLKLDAITAPDYSTDNPAYQLLSGDPNIDPDDLYFKEFSHYAQQALKEAGLHSTQQKASAQQKIYFSFGINRGTTKRRTYSTPVYEYTGGESISIKEHTIRDGAAATTTTELYVPYRYQLVGRERRSSETTTYKSYLRLEGRSNDEQAKQLWMITVEADSANNDLRVLIPLMLSKAQPFIGKNSGKIIEIKASQNDPAIEQFIGKAKP